MPDDMQNIETVFELAKSAYRRKEYGAAKALLDKVIELSPNSPEGAGALYLRARGFEDGNFGTVDLDSALSDFSSLRANEDYHLSDAALGIARVLYKKNADANAQDVIKLYKTEICRANCTEAMVMLGSLYEHYFHDYRLAGKYYLMAFYEYNPWGLRHYARLKIKNGKFVQGVVLHVFTTALSPFFILFNEIKQRAGSRINPPREKSEEKSGSDWN